MKIIELAQGSKEWKKWRNEGITATDITAIMGTSPYLNARQLCQIKVGQRKEPSANKAMLHGKKYEEIARRWVNNKLGFNLIDLCIEDEETSLFRASLDGWDDFHEVLCEIKCPISEKVLEECTHTIPDHWIDQIQWQMLITGAKKALLVIYNYKTQSGNIIDIPFNYSRVEIMKQKAHEFWEKVKRNKPLELEDNKEYLSITDSLKEKCEIYKKMMERKQILEKEILSIKEEIKDIVGEKSYLSEEFKIDRYMKAGSIDYKKLAHDHPLVDIEEYRKPDTEVFYIRCKD